MINEAKLVLTCRKLYVGRIEESGFVDASLLENYKAHDYHSMYVLEIEKALAK